MDDVFVLEEPFRKFPWHDNDNLRIRGTGSQN